VYTAFDLDTPAIAFAHLVDDIEDVFLAAHDDTPAPSTSATSTSARSSATGGSTLPLLVALPSARTAPPAVSASASSPSLPLSCLLSYNMHDREGPYMVQSAFHCRSRTMNSNSLTATPLHTSPLAGCFSQQCVALQYITQMTVVSPAP
jgi:hypothetical protein